MRTRRLYRRSLAGLVLLLPLALWTASGEGLLDYLRSRAVDETVVAAGGRQDYGGSSWRIDGFQSWSGVLPAEAAAPGLNLQAASLPPGVHLLRVRVALRPGDAEAVKHLDRCELELADSRGRRWKPQPAPLKRREFPARCSGSLSDPPQVALEFRFEQDFLLPGDAVDDVAAVIRLGAEKPRLLRLQLR